MKFTFLGFVWSDREFDLVLVLRSSNCAKSPFIKNNGACQRRMYSGFLVETFTIVAYGFSRNGRTCTLP